MNSFARAILFTWLLCMLCFALSLRAAEEQPTSGPSLTTEQKKSMDVLDNVIARFQSLLDRDDDLQHKAETQKTLDGFKERRDALSRNFDQSRYEELRTELNLEYQRLASWMSPPLNPPAKTGNSATRPATGTN